MLVRYLDADRVSWGKLVGAAPRSAKDSLAVEPLKSSVSTTRELISYLDANSLEFEATLTLGASQLLSPITSDSTPNWTVYVNGVSLGSQVGAAITDGGHNLSIGQQGDGTTQCNEFVGRLAEVAIWKGATLSAAEITALASGTSPSAVRSGSLTGYWPLYGVASPEPDYSGNVGNGTVTGSSAANHCPCGKYPAKGN